MLKTKTKINQEKYNLLAIISLRQRMQFWNVFLLNFTPIGGLSLWKGKKWRRAHRGLQGSGQRGEQERGGGADVGCLLFKARFSPDTSVLFINSFSRAVKNQCALHCKQFIMMGGWKKKGEKSSTATELICLSTITQRCSEEEAGAPRQSLNGSMKPQAVIDELLLECKSQAHRHVI